MAKAELLDLDPKNLKMIKGNRMLDMRHLARVKTALATNPRLDLAPIRVNKNYEIIDGQHRVVAAMELGLKTVPCLVVDGTQAGLEEAQLLNQLNRNWTAREFAFSFAARGFKDYIVYKNFLEKTGFDLRACMIMLTGGKNHGDGCFGEFKRGRFQVTHPELACKWAVMVEDFKDYFEHFRSRAFVLACLKCFRTKGYQHSTMLSKLERLQIRRCGDQRSYVVELQRIYNYGTPREKRLVFIEV